MTTKLRTVRWPFAESGHDLDEVFRRFFGAAGDGVREQNHVWTALASTWEDDQHLYFEFDVPGVTQDAIDLQIEDGKLLLATERTKPTEDRTHWQDERHYGQLRRVAALPDDVDTQHVDAELKNGVLRVTLQKVPEAKPQKIHVQVK